MLVTLCIHILIIAFLCWQLYHKSYNQPLISFYWWGLLGKLLASAGVGLLYIYYYPYQGDTFAYFSDAAKLSAFAWKEPVAYIKILLFNQASSKTLASSLELWHQPRAFFMAKLVSVFCLFTWNNYWLCGWYLSLFSFVALWRLANTLVTLFPSSQKAAGIAFLLFPSVIMWSAGLTKESVAMTCIAGLLQVSLSWKFKLKDYSSFAAKITVSVLLLCLLVLLWKLKYYYLAALLPAFLAFLLTDAVFNSMTSPGNIIPGNMVKLSVLITICVAILISATFLHPNLYIDNFLQALVINHNITLAASTPYDIIYFSNLQPVLSSVLRNLPVALFSGLFRPLIWEGNSVFQYYVGLENTLLLICAGYVLLIDRRWLYSIKNQSYVLLMGASLGYILLLAGLLALSSPNFGALSRYKVAFLPFFVYLLIWAVSIKRHKM